MEGTVTVSDADDFVDPVPVVSAVERPVARSALDDPEADAMDEDSDVGLGDVWDEPPEGAFASPLGGDGAWPGPFEEARIGFGRARRVSVVAVSHWSGCIWHR